MARLTPSWLTLSDILKVLPASLTNCSWNADSSPVASHCLNDYFIRDVRARAGKGMLRSRWCICLPQLTPAPFRDRETTGDESGWNAFYSELVRLTAV